MNAPNMASNIMEGLSAYTAEDIVVGFNGVDSRGTIRILPDNITCESHGEVTYSPTTGYAISYTVENGVATGTPQYVNGGTVSVNGLKMVTYSDKKYYLYAAGVKQNTTTYDVLVSLDASSDSGYSGDVNKNGIIDATESELYNDYSSIAITTQNNLVDSTFKDNSTVLSDAYAMFEPYKILHLLS